LHFINNENKIKSENYFVNQFEFVAAGLGRVEKPKTGVHQLAGAVLKKA
jgi:hypothetical protein